MVNQARFRSLSTFLSTDRGIASLSNAIWLHAASMIPEKYARWEEHCYRSARHHLEKLETEENDGTFMSIDALQAVVLVALYEFKQMHFARAWLTIGKAMVRLHCYQSIAQANTSRSAPCSNVRSSQDGWKPADQSRLWFSIWATSHHRLDTIGRKAANILGCVQC